MHGSTRAVTGVTLLIGGARSGKSTLSVEMGERSGLPVTFLATAQALDGDMAERIDRHRAERPDWPVVEEPVDLVGALATVPGDHLVIVDCLTLWVSNLLFADLDDATIGRRAASFSAAIAGRPGPSVVVTNEVGLGLHPDTALGRRYRDLLGRVNQVVAARADRTLWLVAGRAVPLVDPWELLE